jgi:hypothetical protein
LECWSGLLLLLNGLGLFTWLRALGSVLGASTTATINAKAIKTTADDMISDTGEILHTASANEHDGVLLEVMSLTADVGDHFLAVGEANLGNRAKR